MNYITTINYRGVNIPIAGGRSNAFIARYRIGVLISLAGPPYAIRPDDTFYRVEALEGSGAFLVSKRESNYIVEIEGVFYLPKVDGEFCHINIILALGSKLGREL